jgi:hypothetical protein
MFSYLYNILYGIDEPIKWDLNQQHNKYLVTLQIKIINMKLKRANTIPALFNFTIDDQIKKIDYLLEVGELEVSFNGNNGYVSL